MAFALKNDKKNISRSSFKNRTFSDGKPPILYDARFFAARSPLIENFQHTIFYNETTGESMV